MISSPNVHCIGFTSFIKCLCVNVLLFSYTSNLILFVVNVFPRSVYDSKHLNLDSLKYKLQFFHRQALPRPPKGLLLLFVYSVCAHFTMFLKAYIW